MNNVSFKGTYFIPHSYKYVTGAIKSVEGQVPKTAGLKVFETPKNKDYQGDTTLVVDDGFDKKLEALLATKNIKFEKRPRKEIYNKNNILNRIEPSGLYTKTKYRLIDVNEKFDELCEKSGLTQRYYYTNEAWDKERREFLDVLKSETRIDPPVVQVYKDDNGDLKAAFERGYLEYTVLKEMGLKNIPVIMTSTDFKLAQKQGLVV